MHFSSSSSRRCLAHASKVNGAESGESAFLLSLRVAVFRVSSLPRSWSSHKESPTMMSSWTAVVIVCVLTATASASFHGSGPADQVDKSLGHLEPECCSNQDTGVASSSMATTSKFHHHLSKRKSGPSPFAMHHHRSGGTSNDIYIDGDIMLGDAPAPQLIKNKTILPEDLNPLYGEPGSGDGDDEDMGFLPPKPTIHVPSMSTVASVLSGAAAGAGHRETTPPMVDNNSSNKRPHNSLPPDDEDSLLPPSFGKSPSSTALFEGSGSGRDDEDKDMNSGLGSTTGKIPHHHTNLDHSGSGDGEDDDDDEDDDEDYGGIFSVPSSTKQPSTTSTAATTTSTEKPRTKKVQTKKPRPSHENKDKHTTKPSVVWRPSEENDEDDVEDDLEGSENKVNFGHELSTRFPPYNHHHTSTLRPHDEDEDSENTFGNEVSILGNKHEDKVSFFARPGILAAVIGGAVVGLLCAILLVMLILYNLKKKDEGSYVLDEHKRSSNGYTKAATREFYA